MSEQIPESIPTSADPRSNRPLKKKRAVSPHSLTASQISTLMSNPSLSLTPNPSLTPDTRQPTNQPPEIVQNVQGSSAGAGSGEFHVYKASRRREYERIRGMEEEVRHEVMGREWERERREREGRDEERTRRNRERRARKRRGGVGKGKGKGKEEGEGAGEEGGEDGDSGGSGGSDGVRGGKVMARVVGREGGDGRGQDGEGEDGEGKVVEEIGLIIHDDD